ERFGICERLARGMLVALRIGDELEPLTVAYSPDAVREGENNGLVVGYLATVDEDFNIIVQEGSGLLFLAGDNELVADLERQEEGSVGVRCMDADAQVLGRFGVRIESVPGVHPSGVHVVVERGFDAGAVLSRGDLAVGDGARGPERGLERE